MEEETDIQNKNEKEPKQFKGYSITTEEMEWERNNLGRNIYKRGTYAGHSNHTHLLHFLVYITFGQLMIH